MTNQTTQKEIPAEIKGWNWGAFFLNWIWGLFNNTFIALLCFIPCLNVIMPFVLGFKGNEWAWKNKNWESIEAFKATQRKWALAGLAVFTLVLLGSGAAIFGTFTLMKKSDVYQGSLQILGSNETIKSTLGEPIETGFFVTGNINVSVDSGTATISYSISGPKGEAKVYVNAHKKFDTWEYDEVSVELDNGEIVNLIQ